MRLFWISVYKKNMMKIERTIVYPIRSDFIYANDSYLPISFPVDLHNLSILV